MKHEQRMGYDTHYSCSTSYSSNNVVEENVNVQQESQVSKEEVKKLADDSSLESISIENATYLQNLNKVKSMKYR